MEIGKTKGKSLISGSEPANGKALTPSYGRTDLRAFLTEALQDCFRMFSLSFHAKTAERSSS